MNLENIEILLENLYKMPFLLKFERIKFEEKEYKNSQFYKKHKISLWELYMLFEKYKSTNLNLKDIIQDLLVDFDTDLIWVKIVEFIEGYENFDTIREILKDLLDNFNVESLEPFKKDLEEKIKKVK